MNKKYIGAGLVFLAGTMWGVMGVFVRSLSSCGFSSLEIATLRLCFAAFFMALSALLLRPSAFKINPRHIWCFFGSGVISLSVFSFSYFTTLEMASMSTAAILVYTAPIMVTLMSAVIFHEKLTLQKILCLIAAFIGCFFVAGVSREALVMPPLAIVTGLISGLSYALYSIFGRFALNRGYSSFTVALYTFIFAGAGVLVFTNVPELLRKIAAHPQAILTCIGMSVFTAFLPYVLYTAGLERMESGKASIISSVEPVVATICGMLFFNEFPDLFGWLGIVLVLGAIVMLNVDFRRRRQPQSRP